MQTRPPEKLSGVFECLLMCANPGCHFAYVYHQTQHEYERGMPLKLDGFKRPGWHKVDRVS